MLLVLYTLELPKPTTYSVGRCVEIWARGNFWAKVINVDFQLEKYMQFKENDVSNFFFKY